MENHLQNIKATTIPLQGSILIEASAGTGKTHTISILYLRLLLGLRNVEKQSPPLKVEQILVVTFTEAATLELKNRINSHIHELRMACLRGRTDNPQFMLLLSQIDNLKQAATILLTAELHIDTAAIFTIHSFCQRMLYTNMIECGMMFKPQIIEDDHFLYHKIIVDFWKRHFSNIPINIAKLLLQEWSSPNSLLETLWPWLKGELPELKYPSFDALNIEQHHKNLINRIKSFKAQWSLIASKIKTIILWSGNMVDNIRYNINILLLQWMNKISVWSKQETYTYDFPKELEKFRQTILSKKFPNSELIFTLPIFKKLEIFLSNPPSLREWVIVKALLEIHAAVRNKNRTVLGFDDLIHLLDESLYEPSIGPDLAQRIRCRYPIALIDEFQDTDSLQYRIYNKIYIGHSDTAIILIGDPKQAIYSFRGADIFSYMYAKTTIDNFYTLDTNWRSSPNMVTSINKLFSCNKNPFIFSKIPFVPVKTASKNSQLFFNINNQPQVALRFCLQPGEIVNFSEYQQFMGHYCATQIKNWIVAGKNNHAHLINGNNIHQVTPADIFVLVRNQHEATVMQDALKTLNLASIYHSSFDSVYSTQEASEILCLLKAILITNKSQMLRTALATSIFGFDAKTIEKILHNQKYCNDFYQKFIHYRKIWFKSGVMPMLHELIISNQIYKTLLKNHEERRLIDILHLIELLQKASFQLDHEYALIRWLELQITQSSHQTENENQRLNLENDKNLIQIVSIHKSKGLQYPLVWLPFISSFRQVTDYLYHDRITLRKILDLHYENISKKLAEEERLAEDLRILYVALTRSIWHCSVGIAPLIKGNKKNSGKNDLHLSAIGYLIQRGKPHNATELFNTLNKMQSEEIELVHIDYEEHMKTMTVGSRSSVPTIEKKVDLIKSINLDHNLSESNTNIISDSDNPSQRIEELFPDIDLLESFTNNKYRNTTLPMSPHSFPTGITSSIFLHDLLKKLDFSKTIPNDLLKLLMNKYGFNLAWMPVLKDWINNILHAYIDDVENISLSKIENHHKNTQWMFNLNINPYLNTNNIYEVIKPYYTDNKYHCISFNKFGYNFLKGCIDLIFKWRNKYYLVDYKTIWLGKNHLAYDSHYLEKIIQSHGYDLQYILYTLAFHRYLKHCLSDYNYDLNFGGAYFLFLRGINADKSSGIWKIRPNIKIITALDDMVLENEVMKDEK
ncbi:MAG: exodeoxyribonuclease V subunit beta [Candidatus Dasytiphilus stammeri]